MGVWEYGSMGVWEYGSMGVWEYGSMGVWEYGSMGVWECKIGLYCIDRLCQIRFAKEDRRNKLLLD
jgi:hypothetical protein